MRVRNHKIELFEKRNITEKPILIFWNMIFLMIFISGGLLMHWLYKETWSIIWVSITSVITFLMLSLAYFGLMNWNFAEESHEKKYIPLKKWRRHNFLEKHLRNINTQNHQNYFQSQSLHSKFLRQILYPRILFIIVLCWWPIMLFILLIGSELSTWVASLYIWIVFTIFYIVYLSLRDYFHIKRTIKLWSTCILRRRIWSYYISEKKIFFY